MYIESLLICQFLGPLSLVFEKYYGCTTSMIHPTSWKFAKAFSIVYICCRCYCLHLRHARFCFPATLLSQLLKLLCDKTKKEKKKLKG